MICQVISTYFARLNSVLSINQLVYCYGIQTLLSRSLCMEQPYFIRRHSVFKTQCFCVAIHMHSRNACFLGEEFQINIICKFSKSFEMSSSSTAVPTRFFSKLPSTKEEEKF